jgi:hypothetical protein
MVDDFVCWVAAGAKLFYLSGMKNGSYMKREVLNLARFISVMKFRPLNWRMAHPYLLTDRLEVVFLASPVVPTTQLLEIVHLYLTVLGWIQH